MANKFFQDWQRRESPPPSEDEDKWRKFLTWISSLNLAQFFAEKERVDFERGKQRQVEMRPATGQERPAQLPPYQPDIIGKLPSDVYGWLSKIPSYAHPYETGVAKPITAGILERWPEPEPTPETPAYSKEAGLYGLPSAAKLERLRQMFASEVPSLPLYVIPIGPGGKGVEQGAKWAAKRWAAGATEEDIVRGLTNLKIPKAEITKIIERLTGKVEFGMKGADIGVQKDIFGGQKVVRTTPSGAVEEILPTVSRGKGEQLGLGEKLPEVAPTPELRPIQSNVGKGYDILSGGKKVGEITYGEGELFAPNSLIIGRVDVVEQARRAGNGTKAVLEILDEAERTGKTLYTGMLEPDGVKFFEGLEKNGVISLKKADQPMLGNIITRGRQTIAATTKYPKLFDRPVEELLGDLDKLSYEELRHYQSRLGAILSKGMKGVEEKWSGKYQQIGDLWDEFDTALTAKGYAMGKAGAAEEAGRVLRGGLQDRVKAVWNDLSWRNYIMRGDFPEAVSVDTFKKWNGGRVPSNTSIIQKGLNKGKIPTEIAADDMLSELGYRGTVTKNAIDQLRDDFYILHKLYLEQGGKRVETVVTKGPRTLKGVPEAPVRPPGEAPAPIEVTAERTGARFAPGEGPKPPLVVGEQPPLPPPLAGAPIKTARTKPFKGAKPLEMQPGFGQQPPQKPRLHTAQQFDAFWKRTREGKPKVPLSQRLKEGALNFEKQVVDEASRLNKLGKSVEESTALFRGMSRKAESIIDETFETIRTTLGKGNEKLLDEVDKYLFLKHNIEVIKMKGAKRPFVTLDGVKYTAQDLGWRLGEMEEKLGTLLYQKVKQAAEAVPAAYNKLLRESSELPANVVNDLIQKYPYYNPLIYDTESSFVKKGVKRLGRTIQELSEVAPMDTPKSPLSVFARQVAYRTKNNAENVVRQNIADALVAKGGGKIVDKQPRGAFVEFFTKGEKKYVELTDEYKWVANELKFFDYDRGLIQKVTRIGQMINALPRAFYTTLSPIFMLRNLAVDGLTAFLHEGVTPIWYLKGLARTLKNIVKTDPIFTKMTQAGGAMGGYTAKSAEDVWKIVTKTNAGKVLEIKNPKALKRLLNPATLMQELGYAVEGAPRVGLFEKLTKEGVPVGEVALRARRVTIDFDRMGEVGRLVNGWYLFANASKEGLLLPFRALRDKPMARVRIAGFTSLLIGTYTWNRRFPEYEDVPDQVKYGSWIIMLPSNEYNKYGEKVPHYIRITPMLREWGMLAAPFVYLLRKLDGSNPEEFGTFLRTYATTFSPVSQFLGGEGTVYFPTELGQTMMDISYNVDSYRNRPIVDDDLLVKPKSEQYDEYTSDTAIRLGHVLNQSPKIIDYFLNNMTGTLGRELVIVLDRGIKAIDTSDTNTKIASLTDQLRDIQVQYKNDPKQIPDAREKFLDKLSFDERQAVLSRERMPEDKIPIINGIVSSFFRNKGTGGQIFRTEKAKIAPELKQFKYDAEDVFNKYYDQKEGDARANYRTKNPETDAILFLYGKVTTFKTNKAKKIAEEYYFRYGKFDYELRDPNEAKPGQTPTTPPSWAPEREKVTPSPYTYTPGYLPPTQTTPSAPGTTPKRKLPTLGK